MSALTAVELEIWSVVTQSDPYTAAEARHAADAAMGSVNDVDEETGSVDDANGVTGSVNGIAYEESATVTNAAEEEIVSMQDHSDDGMWIVKSDGMPYVKTSDHWSTNASVRDGSANANVRMNVSRSPSSNADVALVGTDCVRKSALVATDSVRTRTTSSRNMRIREHGTENDRGPVPDVILHRVNQHVVHLFLRARRQAREIGLCGRGKRRVTEFTHCLGEFPGCVLDGGETGGSTHIPGHDLLSQATLNLLKIVVDPLGLPRGFDVDGPATGF
ncbi:hypothetical protein GGX14DRAFT_576072 [Mycena pura]|uniref:Uncharacterized protein n=1 Tax=Mycena pura TaxID=153505 RepID=A0AAD6Y5C7_9AGAR|nr:hypothetical protein GGX14DRAFT_576072 [Mycena pura]